MARLRNEQPIARCWENGRRHVRLFSGEEDGGDAQMQPALNHNTTFWARAQERSPRSKRSDREQPRAAISRQNTLYKELSWEPWKAGGYDWVRPCPLNKTVLAGSPDYNQRVQTRRQKHGNCASEIIALQTFFFIFLFVESVAWLGEFAYFCLILKRIFFLHNYLHLFTASSLFRIQGDLSLPQSTTPNSLSPLLPTILPLTEEFHSLFIFLTVPRGPTFGHQREYTLQGPFLFALSSL